MDVGSAVYAGAINCHIPVGLAAAVPAAETY